VLENLCETADSFYQRGYAFGSTGNISVRAGGRVWITPTGKSLKGLRPGRLACVSLEGESLSENLPSKELPFHLAVRAGARSPAVRAVLAAAGRVS
jgi:L-fuculose-phosphate aldolase